MVADRRCDGACGRLRDRVRGVVQVRERLHAEHVRRVALHQEGTPPEAEAEAEAEAEVEAEAEGSSIVKKVSVS